jgi:hypothetical protein
MRIWTWAPLLLLAACSDSPTTVGSDSPDFAVPGGAPSDFAIQDLQATDLADNGGSDGAVSCSVSTSPSGYACDAWSVHLYAFRFVSANASTIRLQLWHDPYNEGNAGDMVWPLAHDYQQFLDVDFANDATLRQFLCIVFAKSTPPASYPVDATLLNLNHGSFSLPITPNGTERWQNVSELCAVPSLPVVVAPNLVTQPTLPDVALMIKLVPDMRLITVGATVTGWLARGVIGADEDRELVPPIHGTVVTVSTHDCMGGFC